jgi:hypothetical protein
VFFYCSQNVEEPSCIVYFDVACLGLITIELTVEQRLRLQNLAEVQVGDSFGFLGFSLNLQTGEFIDDLQKGIESPEVSNPTMHHQITELLVEYSGAAKKPLGGRQVKFRMFPGGVAYENAFMRKSVDPIAKAFAACPEVLVEAGMLLGGRKLELGQASIEVPAFNLVPITYILWADVELPPTANVLFDETGNNYLNAEGLANLAELTTWRLLLTQKLLKNP